MNLKKYFLLIVLSAYFLPSTLISLHYNLLFQVLKFVSLFVIVINWQIFPFQLSNICYWWQHKLAYISSMTKILILLGLICPLADYQPTWCYKFRSKLMLFFFRPTAYFLLSLLKLSRFTNVKYNTSIRKLILWWLI